MQVTTYGQFQKGFLGDLGYEGEETGTPNYERNRVITTGYTQKPTTKAGKKKTTKKTFVLKATGNAEPGTASATASAAAGAAASTGRRLKSVGGAKRTQLFVEVPAGSSVNVAATFISSAAQNLPTVPGLLRTYYTRGSNLYNGATPYRDALEKTREFTDVTAVLSRGGGGVDLRFTVNRDWNQETDLREFVKKICQSVGSVNSIFIKVTRNAATNETRSAVRNNALDNNNKVDANAKDAFDGAGKALADLIANSGYLLPVAVLGGGLILVIAIKK